MNNSYGCKLLLILTVLWSAIAADYFEFSTSADCTKWLATNDSRVWSSRSPTFASYCCMKYFNSTEPWNPNVNQWSDSPVTTVLPLDSVYLMCPTEYDQCGGNTYVVGSDYTELDSLLVRNASLCKYRIVNGNTDSRSISWRQTNWTNWIASLYKENGFGNYTLIEDFKSSLNSNLSTIDLNQSETLWVVVQKTNSDDNMRVVMSATSLLQLDSFKKEARIWEIVAIWLIILSVFLIINLIVMIRHYRKANLKQSRFGVYTTLEDKDLSSENNGDKSTEIVMITDEETVKH